ncbi:MAG: hypothetical protein V3S64_08655, partial [bacterium]
PPDLFHPTLPPRVKRYTLTERHSMPPTNHNRYPAPMVRVKKKPLGQPFGPHPTFQGRGNEFFYPGPFPAAGGEKRKIFFSRYPVACWGVVHSKTGNRGRHAPRWAFIAKATVILQGRLLNIAGFYYRGAGFKIAVF